MATTKRKSYGVGEQDEEGKVYKLNFNVIDRMVMDTYIAIEFDKISRLKDKLSTAIKNHNHFVDFREEIATIPDEYLRCSVVGRSVTMEDFRRIIIAGCDAEIEKGRDEIKSIRDEWGNERY